MICLKNQFQGQQTGVYFFFVCRNCGEYKVNERRFQESLRCCGAKGVDIWRQIKEKIDSGEVKEAMLSFNPVCPNCTKPGQEKLEVSMVPSVR